MEAQSAQSTRVIPRNQHGASTVIENVAGQRVALTPPDYVDDAKIALTENSRKVLERRYLRRDLDGSLLETPSGMFYRVAYHVAQVENEHGDDAEVATRAFYELMSQYRFFPNSPTFTGAGTPLGQLAACFVLPIEDDMGKSSDGIFSTLRVAALIQQTGGGNGFSFSRLRPKGDVVHTSAGRATGPVGFLRVYDQAFGEIAQGGCLLPETLVFTDRGLLRLDEMVDPETAGWQDHQLTVATDEGQRTSPRGYNNGVAPVLKVTTKQGLTLTGTYNHKVKVMSADGPAWRRLDQLQPGDSILVMLGQHQGTPQSLRPPQRQHGNQIMPEFPAVLDESFAFLLGYLAGDGFVAQAQTDHRVGFNVSHDSYLLAELPQLIQQVFPGCTVHRQQKLDDASTTFVVDSRAIKDFLATNGLTKARSSQVTVPRLVRQSPASIVGAYLRGLFEADGAISHGYPQLSTTSYRLAQEVATLLIGLGCPVTLRQHSESDRLGTTPQWNVRLDSHVALAAWQASIGCDPRSRFTRCAAYQPDLQREQSYVLPHAAWWMAPVLAGITLPQHDRQQRGQGQHFTATDRPLRRKLLRYARNERQLTLSGFQLLAQQHPEFSRRARPVDNLWFVQVEQVEPAGEALTLDLEVDENHTYLANGLVTHNTRRGANMGVLRVDHPDIEEFIESKATEGAITNFNISVAITDEFMQAVQDDADFELRNPRNGAVHRVVRARDLFAKIIRYAHHNGEPGALFIDAANRTNPVPHLYDLEATNPCVTGDTRIYTEKGMYTARELHDSQDIPGIVLDSRFGADSPVAYASPVFYTGDKMVYRLKTAEGYELDATGNHQVMTTTGWTNLEDLKPGDKVHILNRKGGFGSEGDLGLGRTLGWLIGDGTLNIAEGAGLLFFQEEQELAPLFAEYINEIVAQVPHKNVYAPTRTYPVGIQPVAERDETRVISTRLREALAKLGVTSNERVPDVVYVGSEEMQRGFLQALFSADATVLDNVAKGVSVRLWSAKADLLKDVQRLLLNFGIASKLYLDRKRAGYKQMPDGHGGQHAYYTQAGHELVIAKQNLVRFQAELGFLQPAKREKLAQALRSYGKRGPYAEYFTATVQTVHELGVQAVYDLTEPLTHSFVANGIVVHNCGEQWLGPNENCCLGSVNLGEHVTHDAEGNPVVDWALLRRSVHESTHFLDNVVSANAYVPSVPEVAAAAYRARRIGLGIMGLGDMMYKLGIRYGSEEGQEFAGQIVEFVRYHCMEKSIELASQRGPFLAFEGSIYDARQPGGMKWQPPTPLFPYTRDWGRPALDWNAIVQGIQEHGIRNAAQTTVAPTGTIATVCGCEGYGCEPVFALGYIRHFKDGDKDVELVYTSPLFEQALNQTTLSEARKNTIKQHVASVGSCQDMDDLPAHLRHTFVVSSDISAEEHVRMQAAIQAFVDNSISKCVVGDTLLLTINGLMPIAQVSDLRLPDQFAPLDMDIVSPDGVETARQFYYGGYRETCKVTLDYGFGLEATGNHRIHVLAEDGSIQFRALDELALGDTVVLYANQQVFGSAGRPLPSYSGHFRTNSKAIRFPSHMDEPLAFFLGCLTAEGAITDNGINITNNDVALLDELNDICDQAFGVRGTIYADKRNQVHYLQVNSRPLRNWLLADLGLEAGAENKVIPHCILRAAKTEIAEFLRGLFLDGYMTLDGRLFGLTVASRKLIRQLQIVLLNMGVLATIRQSTERAWSLTVQGGELETLAHQVRFVEVWKNERMAQPNLGRVQRFRNYSRLLPVSVSDALQIMRIHSAQSVRSLYQTAEGLQEQEYQRVRVNLRAGHRLERMDAARLYAHLSRDTAYPYADTFFGHDNTRKVYVQVQGMETGYAEVYDINVPGSHSFIANGMGNHNTCNFPEGATEDDVAKAYLLAWELGCKGLTVYVTGSRQEVVLETKATREKKGEASATRSQSDDAPYTNGAGSREAERQTATAAPAGDDIKPAMTKRPRPLMLQGTTYRKDTPLGTAYITVNGDERGEPFEVFLNVGKAGSDVSAVSEAIGRLISLVLRLPSALPPSERLRWVMDEMAGIGGGRPLGFGAKRVRSLPDGIAQVLADYLSDLPPAPEELPAEQLALPIAQRPIGDICPECGEAAFLNVEGCRKCAVCGYSEC